jgi:hypothetical protein
MVVVFAMMGITVYIKVSACVSMQNRFVAHTIYFSGKLVTLF